MLPALALVFCGTAGLAVAELMPQGRAQVPLGVVILGSDGAAAARLVAAADGRLLSYGGWLGSVVAVSDDPDFAARLYRAGASLVFRADGAVVCAATTSTTARPS